jgi:copper chaperone CopZ
MLALAGGCRVRDIRTVTIKVPGMKNQACAKIIQDAFMKQPGLEEVKPDIENRTVFIKYNSMVIAKKNLEYAITAVGFDANDEKADKKAYDALPPECK